MHTASPLVPGKQLLSPMKANRPKRRLRQGVRRAVDRCLRIEKSMDDWLDGPIARIATWLAKDVHYVATQAVIWTTFFALTWWVGGVLERHSQERFLREQFLPAASPMTTRAAQEEHVP